MAVNLSIKNVPEALVARLRSRAERNHRSLQGELMAIVERAARESSAGPLTVGDLYAWGAAEGLMRTNESTRDIRRLRDARAARLGRSGKRSRGGR